jgi:integrase
MTTPSNKGSYDVRIWGIRLYKGAKKTTYTVRWAVAGKPFPMTFETRKLAESFRSKLMIAAKEGIPFDRTSGLPETMMREQNGHTWYELACAFIDMKWPHASARHRKGLAEALATITPALVTSDRGAPDATSLRHALYTWSFNPSARATEPPEEIKHTARWIAGNTMGLTDLADAAVIRRALDALSVKLDGKAAAPATISRKRAALYSALRYGVELGWLDSNPIDRIQWKMPKNTEVVDRRVVVNHGQARALLAAVREIEPALEAFYGCMYYAALRPAEVLHLQEFECQLPTEPTNGDETEWGELLLTGSTQQIGRAWGDSGSAKEDRGLKHRAKKDTRVVPACPDLVRLLRHHITTFGTSPDGRLFVTRTGRFGHPVATPYVNPVSTNTYSRVWRKARTKVLSVDQAATPLAARPYDLRHAAVSLWLNAGVPPTQVAEWAGHSVHVLMKVYAKCVYGQDEAARRRIETALDGDDRTA